MFKPFKKEWSFLFKLRLFLSIITASLIFIFLYLYFVPSGEISYSRTWPNGFRLGKGFIYKFRPGERLDSTSKFLHIFANPVYFSLFTPRTFNELNLEITYRDYLRTETPIIEAGLLKDKLSASYDLQALQNNIIDAIAKNWISLDNSSNSLKILEANNYYNSSKDFWSDFKKGKLKDCSSGLTNCVASYNYPLHYPDNNFSFRKLKELTINQALRGPHSFYLYLPRGDWYLNFYFVDLNQDQASDPIRVSLSLAGRTILTKGLADSKLSEKQNKVEKRYLSLKGRNVKAGVYRVNVNVNSDIVIAKIVSSSNKLVFINHLWPVSVNRPINIFTKSNYLEAQSNNPASLSDIYFANKKFALDKVAQQLTFFNPSPGLKKISLAKSDILIANDSVFSFTQDSFFNPSFKKVDRHFSLSSNIKYIVSNYQKPIRLGVWKKARAHFSLVGANHDNNYYSLLISVPGLKGGINNSDYLEIKEIKASLKGNTLFDKIKSIFKIL